MEICVVAKDAGIFGCLVASDQFCAACVNVCRAADGAVFFQSGNYLGLLKEIPPRFWCGANFIPEKLRLYTTIPWLCSDEQGN
jgi:hypothetical protein